jgi:hypothetical protein
MKRLLLVLLVTATAITAAGQPSNVSAADCLYKRYIYYSDAAHSSLSCGHLDLYCNDTVQTGCQTPYYTVSTGHCICP